MTTPAANAPVTTPTESSSRPTVTDVKFTHRGSQDRVVLVGGAKATYAQRLAVGVRASRERAL